TPRAGHPVDHRVHARVRPVLQPRQRVGIAAPHRHRCRIRDQRHAPLSGAGRRRFQDAAAKHRPRRPPEWPHDHGGLRRVDGGAASGHFRTRPHLDRGRPGQPRLGTRRPTRAIKALGPCGIRPAPGPARTGLRGGTMNPYRYTLAVAVLFALAFGLGGSARAGAPTEQIRTDIDQLYRSLQSAISPGVNDGSSEILDRMFNWPQMAQTVMGRHWQQRTAAERSEFTQLFAGLFRRAYVSRIHVVDASKFQYLGDAIDGDRATVKTKVLTNRGSTLDVD